MTFEENAADIRKNVASLGFNIADLVERKKLIVDHVFIDRNEIEENGEYDLEGLFIRLGDAIDRVGAKRVVLDTIESLFSGLTNQAILRAELRRLFSWLKERKIGRKGYYRGSTIMLSGTSGTGKSTVAACLAHATCLRGERCMYFSFEESPQQILRNMRSIGMDLEPHMKSGLLQFHANRPTVHGLEMHLVQLHRLVDEFKPDVVILDPVTNLASAGNMTDSSSMLIRLIDFLRKRNITAFFISLTSGGRSADSTDEGMSSIVDTWLLLRDVESGGERNRAMYVLKSRGMGHSNQVREFLITSNGVRLVPTYLGPNGVLTGSARLIQEATDAAQEKSTIDEIARKQLILDHRRRSVEAQIQTLRAGFEAERQEFDYAVANQRSNTHQQQLDRVATAKSRKVRGAGNGKAKR